MHLQLKRTDDAALHLQQQGLPIVRLMFGIPLLGWGFLLVFGAGSSINIRWQEDGIACLPEAFMGALFLLIMASMLLPLGWWLVFARRWILLPRGGRQLIQGSTWLIGRSERSIPLALYRALRIAL